MNRGLCDLHVHRAKPALLLLHCLLLASAICVHTWAAGDAELAVQQAKAFGKRGEWPEAEAVLKSSISGLTDPDGLDAIHLWNELGHVHEAQLRFDDAEHDYARAVRLNKGLAQPSLADLAISFNNIGSIAELRRDFRSAEAYFRRALKSCEQAGEADAAIRGAVYANLAASIQQQGRFQEPRPLYEEGLTLLEKTYGADSPEYAKALIGFGLFEYETGNYAKALPLQRKAYEIVTALPLAADSEKAHVVNNLGMTLLEMGSLPEAEVMLRRGLEMGKSARPRSVDLVFELNNIATLEERTGRLSEARRDQTAALQMAEELVGSQDPAVAKLWSNLGKIAVDEGKTAEAKQLYTKALSLWLHAEGKNSNYAATLTSLASVEGKKGHHKLARSMYQEALEIDEKSLGQSHPQIANDFANLGIELCFEQKFTEAAAMFEQAEQIEERTFGADDTRVARHLRMLGVAYARAKQMQNAEKVYRKAIDILGRSGNDAGELIAWLPEYAAILWQEEKFGEAEAAYVRVNGLRVRNAISARKPSSPPYQ